MGIGDWGLGIGDWGLGIGDWANPQSPIPNQNFMIFLMIKNITISKLNKKEYLKNLIIFII
jgi:hypothetical protein